MAAYSLLLKSNLTADYFFDGFVKKSNPVFQLLDAVRSKL